MTDRTATRTAQPTGPLPSRSTVLRLLEREMPTSRSTTDKSYKIVPRVTRGWVLTWTTSDYAHPYVGWVNGNDAHLRSTTSEERDRLRDEALTAATKVLTENGYKIKRETGCLLLLGRWGA